MGVDYDANFGIGYRLKNKFFEDDENGEEFDMESYLDDVITDDFRYFKTGSGSYTGEENEYYLVIKNPFETGLDLTEKKKLLDDFLAKNDLEVDGDFDVVGGLHVW